MIGIVPPLTTQAWESEFAKYQAIPQYQQVNRGMTLAQFKVIYWWEWTHRLLGRTIGAAFLLPFLWLMWRGWTDAALRLRLWIIFALGALQGVAGWWMVASGLVDRVSVSQYRLAFHLTLACIIFAGVLWTAQRLLPRSFTATIMRLRVSALALVALVLCQIYLGALVAGLHAGLIFNTWPLMEGRIIPESSQLLFQTPWWRNFFENPLTVQFMHRMVAYILWAAAIAHAIDLACLSRSKSRSGLALAGAVTIQGILGILVLLWHAPLGLALLHQGIAIAVLAIAVVHAERLTAPRVHGVAAELSHAARA